MITLGNVSLSDQQQLDCITQSGQVSITDSGVEQVSDYLISKQHTHKKQQKTKKSTFLLNTDKYKTIQHSAAS